MNANFSSAPPASKDYFCLRFVLFCFGGEGLQVGEEWILNLLPLFVPHKLVMFKICMHTRGFPHAFDLLLSHMLKKMKSINSQTGDLYVPLSHHMLQNSYQNITLILS